MRLVRLLALLLVARTAGAEPRRIAVDTPLEAYTGPRREAGVAPYLYLQRCVGGCPILGTKGTTNINDASQGWTTIPDGGSYTVAEFSTVAGEIGPAADADWNGVVQCMKDVYSPYGIVVSDQPPPAGTDFNVAVIAGQPSNLGLGADILGISPLANDCSAQDNVMSFSFANHHGPEQRVFNICWTAAQESAHAYGLDHEFQFSDGNSACSDPMTYRTDCGGEKFFRNKRASCGEMAARDCKCSKTQNSHQKLLATFGAGTVSTPPPHAQIVYPATGATVTTGWVVHISAGSVRGIVKTEVYLNGSRWMAQPGAKFTAGGQVDPSTYTFYMPATVPDGIIDITGKAYDDLGAAVQTETVTVTKGAPCTADAQCAQNQKCNAGRCEWPAPTAELGDSCAYDQVCKSWTCLGPKGDTRCTQECATDEPTSCPSGMYCDPVADTGTAGFCWPTDEGGCCSVGHDRGTLWAQGCLAFAVISWLRRRRRP